MSIKLKHSSSYENSTYPMTIKRKKILCRFFLPFQTLYSSVTYVLSTVYQGDEPLTLKYLIIPQFCRITMYHLFRALPQVAFASFGFQYMKFTDVCSTTSLNLWVHVNSEWFNVFGIMKKFLNLSAIILYTIVGCFYKTSLVLFNFNRAQQYLSNLFLLHTLMVTVQFFLWNENYL
jgi:hypothetical protein